MGIQINGTNDNISASDGSLTIDGASFSTLQVNGQNLPTAGPLSNRNKIINGDMRIDQRNAGSAVTINASAATYSVDRWSGFGMASAGVFTLNRSTTAPAGFTNSLAATCTTADGTIAAGDRYFIDHRIEGFNIADFDFGTASANTVTLSFWVQSSLTGTYCIGFINDGGARSYVAEYTINAADTWEYKTITLTGDTSGTWLSDNGIGVTIRFTLATGTTYQTTANAWSAGNFNATSNQVNWMSSSSSRTFRITGVQLEVGTVATPFEHRSYGDELARCQRYYWQTQNITGSRKYLGMVQAYASTATYGILTYVPVEMRSDATVNISGSFGYYNATSATNSTSSPGSLDFSPGRIETASWAGGSGLTAGHGLISFWEDDAVIYASAEL